MHKLLILKKPLECRGLHVEYQTNLAAVKSRFGGKSAACRYSNYGRSKVNDYIKERLNIDAEHLLLRAEQEASIQHHGLRGRFRELLINDMLMPWLPPYVSCGTGTILAAENKARQFTQDDVIIYDRSLVPPVLAIPNHGLEGVFLYNSVLMRVEVKSKLTREDIRRFVKASLEIADLRHTVKQSQGTLYNAAYSGLFAYGSDADGKNDVNFQFRRVAEVMREEQCDPLSGIISMICIPKYGFWALGESEGKRCWKRLTVNTPRNCVTWFVGFVSNTCFNAHAERQGRAATSGLEGGIGTYLEHPFEPVPGPY
jgi:hypothetical protein